MPRTRPLAVIALALLSTTAWPNGGPMDWNGPAGLGDGGPRSAASVKLIREDLSLKVGDDPDGYDVEARYTLSNPGAPVNVRYGVPLTWSDPGEGGPEGDALQKAAGSVHIELAGKTIPCAPERVEGEPPVIPVPGGGSDDPTTIQAWCVARLSVPTGDAVSLVLRYRASMTYMDGETSKSALPGFDTRRLVYPLFPAAGWAGRPALNVTLDVGPWADVTTVQQPTGFKRAGSVYSWSSGKADLRALSAVAARVDAAPALRHRVLVATNKEQDVFSMKLSARASSTLKGNYDVSNLLDGRADTAWCEGVDGDGVGEWVELSVANAPQVPYCQLQGLVIVPGYARNQVIYEANGRVEALEVGPCGGAGEQVPITLSARYDRSATLIPMHDSGSELLRGLGETAMQDPTHLCVRLTLRGVSSGSKYPDTCISELAGLVNCG